jgi:hypothetical protein
MNTSNQLNHSSLAFVFGVGLTIFGCIQLIIGLTYRDAAKHEATAQGAIVSVLHGKNTTYDYEFRVNGIKLSDNSGACRTPLATGGCREGGQVLVFYAYEPMNISMLEDFAGAAREKLHLGSWMAAIGVLSIGVSMIVRRSGRSEDATDDSEEGSPGNSGEDASEILSIAPRD